MTIFFRQNHDLDLHERNCSFCLDRIEGYLKVIEHYTLYTRFVYGRTTFDSIMMSNHILLLTLALVLIASVATGQMCVELAESVSNLFI